MCRSMCVPQWGHPLLLPDLGGNLNTFVIFCGHITPAKLAQILVILAYFLQGTSSGEFHMLRIKIPYS